jgi:L-fucose mutarotase
MLKSQLLQPEILNALGKAGHGAKVLIADGNFAFGALIHSRAKCVWLNLAPGLVTVTDVLKVLIDAIPIEAVDVMTPESGEEPSIHQDFRSILNEAQRSRRMAADAPMTKHTRFAFYDVTRSPDTILVIATGEQRIYANIVLTIGVVMPE